MAKINDIVEEIKSLSLVEVADLVKLLEEEFGVSAAAPVAVVAGGAAAAAAEEKSEFTVKLKEVGANKIAVIKVVREVTGLVYDVLVPTEEAKAFEAKFKEAGATVELA